MATAPPAAGVSTTLPRGSASACAARAELLRQSSPRAVAFCAQPWQADPGIAAGRFDDGLPGLELARALGLLDHADRQAILDRAQRVKASILTYRLTSSRGARLLMRTTGVLADRSQDALELCSSAPFLIVSVVVQGFHECDEVVGVPDRSVRSASSAESLARAMPQARSVSRYRARSPA